MKDDWILDVLADLRAFARGNGMDVLADGLDDLSMLARRELTLKMHIAAEEVRRDGGFSGTLSRAHAACERAG